MQRAISPAMARSSASGDSSAPGVSMTLTSGSPSSWASRMPRRASRSAPGPMACPGTCRERSWPMTTHGWSSSRVSATRTVESRSPSSVPRSCNVPVAPWASRSRTPTRSVRRVRSTLSQAAWSPTGREARSGNRPDAGPVDQHREGAVDHGGQVLGGHDPVDDTGGGEVLRDLDARSERPPVEAGVDLGAEEAHQRAGLRDGHVAERAPRGVHAAGRGVAQVDEVGQAGGAVVHQRAGDLDHPHEGGRALLHAGAARRGAGQQRQPLGGRPAHGRGDAVRGGAADGAGEEAELVDDDRDRPAADLAAPGQHRLVGAGLRRGGLERGAVVGVGVGQVDGLVPRGEGALVEHQVEQLVRGPALGVICWVTPRPRRPRRGSRRRAGRAAAARRGRGGSPRCPRRRRTAAAGRGA